ncbi:MAG: PQQ-binding-like beta-propeller repeat protein [bacterium]|nr:PQQ-binding-like beta-propeller repeat protein [bacterium]
MSSIRYTWVIILLGIMAGAVAAPPASAPDQWAQFHGPRRDNKSTEKNLLTSWPASGPKLVWAKRGVGSGYAGVAISGKKIYTAGNIDGHTVITAMGLDGKILWQKKNGPVTRRSYPGSRGTPTVDCGKVYHLGPDGAIICLDAETGREIWAMNVLEKFKGTNCTWGLSESLLIDGQKVICAVGGDGSGIVALDKDTGGTLWSSPSIGDKPGYASPIVIEYGGLRQIVTAMSRSIVSLDAATGKVLWKFAHRVRLDVNVMTPIYHDGHVFVSGPNNGSTLLKLKVTGKKCSTKIAWKNSKFENKHGGVVLVDGYLLGHSSKGSKMMCVEFKTGKVMYSVKHEAAGKKSASLTFADGMLYVQNDRKKIYLVPAGPKAFKPVSHFAILPGGSGPLWAHPVVFGGRLYVRHDKILMAYDISAK